MANKHIQISDTIHGTIKLNQIEKEIISTQIFNRLHNIAQNSTVYLTFPTNRTKRFEHSVGTMWLCGEIFRESLANSDTKTIDNFFMRVQEIIDKQINTNLANYASAYRSKIGDRNLDKSVFIKYKELKIPQEYNNFIPINIETKYISTYTILFQAIRLSGLLHDVGHPPFSHITEYALKDIWNNIQDVNDINRTKRQKRFVSCMEKYFETSQDLHEQIGNKITVKVLDDIICNMPDGQERNGDYIEKQLFKIIVAEVTSAILQEKHQVFAELHRLIDGTLDGDRLDYVSRDPINSGLSVGTIEYDRIISNMRLTEKDGSFIYTPSSKIIDSIDDFFNRRWRMYKQIIYHHRVIKTDFLLQDCIINLAMSYLKESLEDTDDSNILPYDISGLWKAVEEKTSHKHFFDTLIQWDDGWLMTIMKVHYFEEYADMGQPSILCYKLEELLANKKNYFSLIKRMEDFVAIDKSIAEIFMQDYMRIKDLVDNVKSDTDKDDIETGDKKQIVIQLDPILKVIKKLIHSIELYRDDYDALSHDGFLLSKINKTFSNLLGSDWMLEILKISALEIVNEDQDISDAIPVVKKVKTGIPGGKTCLMGGLGVYTVNSEQIKVSDFTSISRINAVLQSDAEFMPVFYIYLLKSREDINYNEIRIKLGRRIANKIMDKIVDKLEMLN